MRARTFATTGLALLALTGCQKPTPGVTVAAGSHSVRLHANAYCRDGQSMARHDCVQHNHAPGYVNVKPGQLVIIDVDKAVAQHGWVLVLTDENAHSSIQETHSFSFSPQFTSGPVINLEVRALDHAANDAAVTGVWKFQLDEQ